MGAIVDEMRDRFEEVAGTRGGGDGTRATSWRPEGKTGRERLVMWMAEENMKRAELRERLAAAADDLARSEAGRMEATQRWLELQSEHGGSVRGDAASDFGDGLSDAGGARTPARTPAIGGQWPGNGSARENGRVAEASERKVVLAQMRRVAALLVSRHLVGAFRIWAAYMRDGAELQRRLWAAWSDLSAAAPYSGVHRALRKWASFRARHVIAEQAAAQMAHLQTL